MRDRLKRAAPASVGAARIAVSLRALCRIEPAFQRAVEKVGAPPLTTSARGYAGLLRIILGQQLSVASARAIFARLEALLGGDAGDPGRIASQGDEPLRAVGLSRQKIAHVRSLAALTASGAIDLDDLPQDDDAAIAQLMEIRGVGRWTAEIYLLVAEARPDIWPAGDLGVRIGLGLLMDLATRPDEKEARAMASAWRPHRSAAALMAWHVYHPPGL